MYEMRENQKLIMMVYASKGNKFIGARTKCLQKVKANGNLKKKKNKYYFQRAHTKDKNCWCRLKNKRKLQQFGKAVENR